MVEVSNVETFNWGFDLFLGAEMFGQNYRIHFGFTVIVVLVTVFKKISPLVAFCFWIRCCNFRLAFVVLVAQLFI